VVSPLRSIAIVALCAAPTAGARAQSVDGWTLTVRTTIDSGSLNSKHWFTSRMRIAGHLVRTQSIDSRITSMALGIDTPTIISNDSTHTSTFVLAKLRRASVTQSVDLASPTAADSAPINVRRAKIDSTVNARMRAGFCDP